jgi:hypothetical protein
MVSIRQMGGIVHPLSAIARITVMLRAYFDESGTHWDKGRLGSRAFVLCGYVAPEDVWDKDFSPKWEAMLKKPNISPPLSYFHAREIEGKGKGRFGRITKREREILKSDAVNIATGSAIRGIASAVLIESYRKYKETLDRAVDDPYMLCFQRVINDVMQISPIFLGEDPNEKIAFIFAHHPRWSLMANDMYNKLLDPKHSCWCRSRLGTIAFQDPKGFAPLQVADHLAFEVFHAMSGARGRKMRPAMRRFTDCYNFGGGFFDDAGIESFIAECKKTGKL